MSIKLMKIIVSDEEVIGKGTPEDPMRRTLKLFNMQGEWILTYDPSKEQDKAEINTLSFNNNLRENETK